MNTYELKLFDGYSNRSIIFEAESYCLACLKKGVDFYPPSYIWSIELL